MTPQEKILWNWIVELQREDARHNTHFSDELKKILEPGQEEYLLLFANMLENEAVQFWHISEKSAPQPQHPNQLLVQSWIDAHKKPEGSQAQASGENWPPENDHP